MILVKVRYYPIDLINECLSLYWVFITLKKGNESHLLPELSYINDIIYVLLQMIYLVSTLFNQKFVITYFKLNNILSFIIMSQLVEIIRCRIFIFKSYKILVFLNFQCCSSSSSSSSTSSNNNDNGDNNDDWRWWYTSFIIFRRFWFASNPTSTSL